MHIEKQDALGSWERDHDETEKKKTERDGERGRQREREKERGYFLHAFHLQLPITNYTYKNP